MEVLKKTRMCLFPVSIFYLYLSRITRIEVKLVGRWIFDGYSHIRDLRGNFIFFNSCKISCPRNIKSTFKGLVNHGDLDKLVFEWILFNL